MASGNLQLHTGRLVLVPCPLAVARTVVQDRAQAETHLGARIPPDWPLDDVRDLLPHYAMLLTADPSMLGWVIWLMIHGEDRVVVGDIGFKGAPDASGTVEIGYSVLPAYRRQGYATEAARALVLWAVKQPRVRRVTAFCLPENAPSIRVLESAGLVRTGISPDGELGWELIVRQ